MAKKIKDEQGNVYVQKKPFYQRWWFIVIVIVVLGSFVGGRKGTTNSTTSQSIETTESVQSSETTTITETTVQASEFTPTDTSDATIESIVTYGDYLEMYELIVNEYITNYEAAVAQYGLADASTYQSMRDQVTSSVEQQKAQYGTMKEAKIMGKSTIVDYLKNYRDELKTFTDQMAAGV